jgi:hypothetical protein
VTEPGGPRTAEAGSRRPAAALAALVIVALAQPALPRDNFVLFEGEPPACMMVDGVVWLAAGRHWSYTNGERCAIWQYDPVTDHETLYRDCKLPGRVYALGQTDSLVFAAGQGLSACSKRMKRWFSLSQYDTLMVEDMAVGDSVVWLATSGHGIVGVEARPWPNEVRSRITTADGLVSNRVLSLYLEGSTLFAGLYRFGDGVTERRHDLIGLGLQAADTRSRSVRDIALPRESLDHKDWLVTWVSRAPVDTHALRVVLWQPWESYYWDYRHAGSRVVKPVDSRGPVEPALDALNLGSDSLTRSRVRAFLTRHLSPAE